MIIRTYCKTISGHKTLSSVIPNEVRNLSLSSRAKRGTSINLIKDRKRSFVANDAPQDDIFNKLRKLLIGILCLGGSFFFSTKAVQGGICDVPGLSSVTVSYPENSIKTGVDQTATITFRAGSTISTGDSFGIRFPYGLPNPSTNTFLGQISSFTVNTSTAEFNFSLSGPNLLLTISSGAMQAGQEISFTYNSYTCQINDFMRFKVINKNASCGNETENTAFSTEPGLAYVSQSGPAVGLNFQEYELAAPVGQVVPVAVEAEDFCGNISFSTTTIDAAILMYDHDYFIQPSLLSLGTSSSDVNYSTKEFTFPAFSSSTVIYYKLKSTDFNTSAPNKNILLQYTSAIDDFDYYRWVRMLNFSGTGLTSVSVDNGTTNTNTSTSFTPNHDGFQDFAYINFSLPSSLNNVYWNVKISSESNFGSVIREYWGSGINNRLSWNGFTDWQPNQPPQIATPGTYYVKITVPGLTPNTSLTINLQSSGVSGKVVDSSSNPVSGVNIDMFGPSGMFTQTQQDGTFSTYGLTPGFYTLRAQKEGYSNVEIQNVNVPSAGTVSVGTITMNAGAVLRLSVIRDTSGGNTQEVWGNIDAFTNNWQHFSYGSLHFSMNSSTSDAGDFYNGTPSSYTAISLVPGFPYTLRFNIPNLGIDNFPIPALAAGQVLSTTTVATKRATIYGDIELPQNVPTGGTWISVEAGRDNNLDGFFDDFDFSNRYHGGGYINSGSTGSYSIFGVANGSYAVVARIPGYVESRSTAVVANNNDMEINFGTGSFSTGGVLSGNVTVTGDTTSHPNIVSGKLRIPINVWSPRTYNGGFLDLELTPNANSTSSTFSVTGLANDLYEVYVHLPGFESLPPGPKYTTVSNGAGSININFQSYNGTVTGNVILPSGATDYDQVEVEVESFDFNALSPDPITLNTSTFSFSGLGSGYYRVMAYYDTTGLIAERGVQVINGQTSNVSLNLSANTYSISGRVTTSASSPYNSIPYLISRSSTTLCEDGSITQSGTCSSPVEVAPGRVSAKKIRQNDHHEGFNNGFDSRLIYDDTEMYFGFYNSSGVYTIPRLSPGTYQVIPNGDFDNDLQNGNEVAVSPRVVTITTSNVTNQNFNLSDGWVISGQLTVASGESESGRMIRVKLVNRNNQDVATQEIYINGTSANFSLENIPNGNYVLTGTDTDFQNKKYSVKDIVVEVKSDHKSNVELKLLKAAKIQGKLRVATSGELITSQNYQKLLPSSLFIEARSNPWFPGGHGRANQPLIDSNGYFNITCNPGTYDLVIQSEGDFGASDAASGKKQFVNIRVAGITVTAGQTSDVGVVEMREGISISGRVTDRNGNPIPNIIVEAEPSGVDTRNTKILEGITNHVGSYTVYGLDPTGYRYYDIFAAPRPDPYDERFQSIEASLYGEVIKTQVDVSTNGTRTIDFVLDLAPGGVTGIIKSQNNGPLILPFDEQGRELPGGLVMMNKRGNIPQDNPIGDIEEIAGPDGRFTVKGLVAGTYDLWALVKNYAAGVKKGISVGNSMVDIGTITVNKGYVLSGTILKQDSSNLSSNEFDTILGVRNGFEELLIGQLNSDASGNISGYSLSGFQSGKTYSVLLLGNNDDLLVLSSTVTLSADTQQNFTVGDVVPTILTQIAFSTATNQYTINYEFTSSLRNSSTDSDNNGTADDSEPTKIVSKVSGNGTLSFPTSWISSDRKRISATYTPGVSDSTFTIRVNATYVTINSTSGANISKSQNFTYFAGIGKERSVRITNATSGSVQLENDTSKFETQPGTFGNDPNLEVNVKFRSAGALSPLAGQALLGSSNGKAAMALARELGTKAYPLEMAGAINNIEALDIDPLSTFYDIFLPAGVSHFFPEGKEANLCLAYDAEVTDSDAYSLNIYYYNPNTGEYILEGQNKSVDVDNKRICVEISHASVFTILSSSDTVITGSGYSGPLSVMNFPNPFNFKSKTVTLQSSGGSQSTISGTMIKLSVPTNIAGDVKIDIFSVTGEKVRTISTNLPSGGAHYYVEWDGTNDHGKKVASGVYIGRFIIAGGNEKFFKMAVIK